MASTSVAMANCVAAEMVSACSAFSVWLTISSYFCIWASICIARSFRLVIFLSACARVLSSERQNGMKLFRILCRDS